MTSNLMAVTFVLLLLFQGSSLIKAQTDTYAAETSLRATLKSGYDQTTRPQTPTHIDIRYYLRSVQALDIANQQFRHTAAVFIKWTDPRLVWDASANSNVSELDINWTWRPVFMIGNSVDGIDIHGEDNDIDRVIAYSNGTVVLVLAMTPSTSCDVNILNFPFDSQECEIDMGFNGHNHGINLQINQSHNEVETGIYLENAEWDLVYSKIELLPAFFCCPDFNFGFLKVTVKFTRLHTFYLNTFLIPTILLSICLVWPFYLPTESGERLGFSLTILLSYTVVLSMTSTFLPTTSKQVPYLANYLLGVLFMCSIAVCNVTIHVKLYFMQTPPPNHMKVFYRIMKPIVFVECKRRNSSKVEVLVVAIESSEKPAILKENDREYPETTSGDTDEITWPQIAEVLDRICFIVYGLGVAVMNIALLIFLFSG